MVTYNAKLYPVVIPCIWCVQVLSMLNTTQSNTYGKLKILDDNGNFIPSVKSIALL